MSFDFWIILTGSLVATSCALIGCFLILRKMAMIGDAISHAVLPGIVIAFALSGSRDSIPVLLGAAFFGVLTTFIIEWLSKKGNMHNDAAIGLVFTFFFAIGIILLTFLAGKIDLDADCVLHGEIVYVPLDQWTLASGLVLGPKKVWVLAGMLLIVLLVIKIGFKGLFLTTFDPAYAVSIGISSMLWHYVLMTLVSMITVVSFESVGAILVVAFLVVPAASAYLLTDKLSHMLFIAVLLGVFSSIGGYYIAKWIDGSIPGAMTLCLGILFLLTFLFSPKYGILKRLWKGSTSDLPIR
jgi:manganese/zinc/iron transport system permease protein